MLRFLDLFRREKRCAKRYTHVLKFMCDMGCMINKVNSGGLFAVMI